jgi:uncharacterized RDD family membrane protein YckC
VKEIRNERARAAQGTRAGFVSQALATVLDAAFIFAVDFVLLAAFGFVRFLVDEHSYRMPQPGRAGNVVLYLVIGVGVLWTAWSGSGRAPGMSVLGLRVVDRGGRRLASRRAFWRALLAVATLGLGVLWVLVSRRNRSVYDVVCGSAVVYDWRPALPDSRQNH